jgi:glycosyltransferase involved in cell wall biosynthesis
MKDIILSIVIPCYNQWHFVEEAINSVESNNEITYEIIVINDGSTDLLTKQKCSIISQRGISIISQNNSGLAKSRNNGINIAKGDYILPLDADNKINPDFINKAIEILELIPEVSIVYSDRQLFGESNDLIKVGKFDLIRMIFGNYIDACAIYRKQVWKEIGGYDENMPIQGLEDWDFWLSAAERNFQFYYIPEPLFYYRVTEGSMIGQLRENPNRDRLIEYVYRKHYSLMLQELKNMQEQMEAMESDLKVFYFERSKLLRSSVKYFYKWAVSFSLNIFSKNLKKNHKF